MAVAYIRVSDPSQVDNFSLDTQEASCRKKAAELGYEKIKVYREEGISAKTIEDRPKLQDALLFCKNKKNNVGIFVVYSFSRLSRKTIDFLTMKALLKSEKISLISIVEPSGDDPENDLISTIISSINQFDNEIKARVVRTNMKARFLQGFPLGRPYLGYVMGTVESKPCPIPQEPLFSLLQTMWQRIKTERLSLREVQREMVKLGYKKYPIQTLSSLFSSKFYMGTIQSAKYGEVQGKHQAMIDESTFYEVRQIITGKQPHTLERHHLNEDFPLRGTLVCEYCGAHLSGAWTRGRSESYPYYSCHSRGKHKITSYNAETIKNMYLDLLELWSVKPKYMQLLTELLYEQYSAKIKQQQYVSTDVTDEVDKLNHMRIELARKHLEGIYSDKDFINLRDDIDNRLTEKYVLINKKKFNEIDFEKVMNFINPYFSSLNGAWDKANLEGKLKISGSMFPVGVVCSKEKLRTQQVERIYEQTKSFCEEIKFSRHRIKFG